MAEEENGHRHMLLEMYEQRFGQNLPPIRRDNVTRILRRRPIWLTKNLSLDTIRKEAATMEFEAERFYVKAAEQNRGRRRPPAARRSRGSGKRPRKRGGEG